MKVRNFSIFIIFFISSVNLFSQQDPEFSQTRSVLTAFNPAAAGANEKVCLNMAHHEQWVGFDGAPSTSFFSADGSFSFFGADHGLGLSIMNDAFAFNSDLGLNLNYAYRMNLGDGKLAFGTSLGIINKSLDPDWINNEGDIAGDPEIPQTKESRVGFDMGLGIFYNTEKLFLGISTTHLNQAEIKYENASPYLVRHYYLTAGYNLQLSNPMFEVMPTFVLKSDGKANQLYINTNLRYNKRFWGGVSYRPGDAIVGIFGLELFNGVKIGYSYDFIVSKISKYSSGTHELTVGYCFDLSLDKTPQRYKSIRFL
ncbi:MAG: type IX secretion system membrane protein PorP/SprF [Bacteroidales bacterium]|nr:type IX secretion system membrane protein PorP/SprF [Bacteroidales bacterium]